MRSCLTIALIAIQAVTARQSQGSGIDKGPYLQNATTYSMNVCWVSDEACMGSVTYSLDVPFGKKAKKRVVRESQPVRFHRVRISGLSPYTQYEYQVDCAGKQSPLSTFKTAADPRQPFRFIAYGDSRTQPAVHAAVIDRMRKFRPDFVIQTGDLVANGESALQWDEFWQVVGPLVRDTPYYPALGNHERNGAPYFEYFAVGRDYSFNYGNAHVVALDSNRLPGEFHAQEEWLKKDLAGAQGAVWRIVFFHHTPYTCSASPDRRVASLSIRKRFEPIFISGKVQMVINGHDHNYQHHLANGIHYVVTGGGGAPLYEYRLDTPFTLRARKSHHHCEITVEGDRMALRAIEPDGKLIEEFELHAGA